MSRYTVSRLERVMANSHSETARIQRRLDRERRARREAERIAEDATRTLYKEQIKLTAISTVASSANESDSTVDTTLRALREFLTNTIWRHARALAIHGDGSAKTVATLPGETAPDREVSQWPLTEAGQRALERETSIHCEQIEGTGHEQGRDDSLVTCFCTIATEGRTFGLIEAYAGRPDDDFEFSRQILEGIAQELAYVYKRDRDRSIIEHMAYYDALTGLGNRALFHDRLDHAIRRARRQRERVGLLFLDVDDFKTINDRAGHAAGDRYLAGLAQRLEEVARESDTIARFSGDEFAVVLDAVPSAEATEDIALRLLAHMRAELSLDERVITPSVSIGLAVFPDDAEDAGRLLQCADSAMYRAKGSGGGGVAAFDPEIAVRRERERAAVERLRAAVEADELGPRYQPLIDLGTGRVVGAEALLRWQAVDATGPGEFVPQLERLGLMMSVGTRVVRAAIRDAARWRKRCGDALRTIAINVSPVQLSSDAFSQALEAALAEYDLPAGNVTLEITEGLYLERDESVLERLRALRDRGVQIALDDFGTGYSSLSYLQHLPVDVVKIDKSFILGLGTKAHYTNLVSAIINLAESLSVEVTAEGIESADIAAAVRRLGCHYGQGFHYGAAVAPDALESRLRPQGS